MLYKYCLFIVLFFIITSCSSSRKYDENKMLVTSISSEKFKEFYKLCTNKEDTIYVYNNTSKFKNCPSINIDCNKTICVLKSNIEIDVNSITPKEKKIVFWKFEKNKNKYKLFFLNIQNNGVIMMTFNRNSEFEKFESGAY
jgi:hypothetical protein